MYYYNENFYDEISDIVEDWDFEQVGESFTLKVENCTLEPIIELSAELIADSLEGDLEERHSEHDAEDELNKIIRALKENIDFEKLNSDMPKLWYPNSTFIYLSKAELLSFCKPQTDE